MRHILKTNRQNILKITNQRGKMIMNFGWGKWDSWGFSISYCNYDRAVCIDFIHWYFFVEFWTIKEVEMSNLDD